ncbi:hypothetical protein H5410_019355 [Solanum commersonii]|uniref:Uncharacterized protein n=1 Tax=Solanum commersonii TaxID=4109 RepID=A0A9J5Z604_SOLCO|nr:hypothetical protein H5410_019355 [Solanum commersonii]
MDKIRDARTRWFEQVKRSCIDALVSRCKRLHIVGTMRGRVSAGQTQHQSVVVFGQI